MKLKPVHILSGVLWLNFLALVWCMLFEIFASGWLPSVTLFMFFVMAAGTSLGAAEQKGSVVPHEKR